MNSTNFYFKRPCLFYKISFHTCRIFLIFIILLIGNNSVAQRQSINFSKQHDIIREPETKRRIKITNNTNQIQDLKININEINEIPNFKLAVVENGNKILPYQSKSIIAETGKKLYGNVLPELYIAKANNNSNEPIIFQVLIDTIKPLIYNTDNKNYKGTFSITLLDDSEPSLTRKNLPTPVSFEISTGTNALLQPQTPSINHTNLPSTQIEITENSARNPVPIWIKTSFNPNGYKTFLTKENRLRIEPEYRKLQGMGVQTLPVNIFLQNNLSDTIDISLTVNKGSINPNKIKLIPNEMGTAELTTEGIGQCKLTVSAIGFLSTEQIYEFVFPWLFVIWALLGSVIGSILKIKLIDKKKIVFLNFLFCILIGIGFSILYFVIGIDLFPLKLGRTLNEFFVFGISFLTALFWEKIYDNLVGLLFSK